MSIASKFCRQKAMYFAPGAKDKFGNTAFDEGVEIACRWEDSVEEVIVAGPEGGVIKVVAKHKALVDQDLEEGGLLWFGTQDEWTYLGLTTVKASTVDHHRIVAFKKTPNVKAKDYLREAWM